MEKEIKLEIEMGEVNDQGPTVASSICDWCKELGTSNQNGFADVEQRKSHAMSHAISDSWNRNLPANLTPQLVEDAFSRCFPNSSIHTKSTKNDDNTESNGNKASICELCENDNTPEQKMEQLMFCYECGLKCHPSCSAYPESSGSKMAARNWNWHCLDCRICRYCKENIYGDLWNITICYNCDSTFHKICLTTTSESPQNNLWFFCGYCSRNTVQFTEQLYKCQYCPRKFLCSEELTLHKVQCLLSRNFACEYCAKRFRKNSELKQHLLTHENRKPFLCGVCFKSFILKVGLVQHSKIHTQAKQFACTKCDKTFNQKSNLIQHNRLHTGVKPYFCPICHSTFRQQSNLNCHMKKWHPVSN